MAIFSSWGQEGVGQVAQGGGGGITMLLDDKGLVVLVLVGGFDFNLREVALKPKDSLSYCDL